MNRDVLKLSQYLTDKTNELYVYANFYDDTLFKY